ncbi:MAG TPA: N-acetyltransferase [Tepidiformaceae bacterium]|nr:N-acetyltransferase [Tepidiformaceae bacterium]HNO65932.1 N-acetyltransferase [Tepidiformaceae bacterium]
MLCIEPAKLSDAEAIHKLVTFWADRGDMLHRPIGEIYEAIRDFKVARLDGEVVGTGSLHIMGADLAEVRSLAVKEDVQAKGIGAGIVAQCVDDARMFGLDRVFALTYKPGFFEKQGFSLANVMEFPQKVWNECVRCPFFTNCKEVAVVLDLKDDLSVPLA